MDVIEIREKKKGSKKTKPAKRSMFLCFGPATPPIAEKCVDTKQCLKADCRRKNRRDDRALQTSAKPTHVTSNVVSTKVEMKLPEADFSGGMNMKRKKKSLLFDTFQEKKFSSRSSSRQSSFRSDSNSSTNSIGRSVQNPDSISSSILKSSTNMSSYLNLSRSSSSNSSRSILSRNSSFGTSVAATSHSSDQQQPAGGQSSISYGLCLLLACIMVLMLWGKVWAIFGTSGWLLLYLSPNVRRPSSLVIPTSELQEIGSARYKKRIVMEGLLDRKNYSSRSI